MSIGISEPVAEFQSTLNQASYAMGAFTPLPYSFLVVLVFADGTAAAAPTMTGGSLTWTRQQRIVYNTTDLACIFTAPVGASPVSTNPTFDCTGDNATGIVMMAFQVVGYNQASPIAQSDSEARTAANPVDTLPGNMNTNNGYIAGFGMPRSPPASTAPASWTEIADIGHANPTAGASGAYRVNGETGTTITFTSASAAYGIVAIEIAVGDISGAGGLASGEAFGSPTIQVTVTPIGIATGEAFGSPIIQATIIPTGIASGEAFGSPSSAAVIETQGIVSGEAFGLPTVTEAIIYDIYPIGIDSGEIVSTPTTLIVVDSQGIVSGELFDDPSIALAVLPDGISTGETQGTPYVAIAIDPQGIVSGEALGNPTITSDITPQAIISGEAFGTPTLVADMILLGVASEEHIGVPAVNADVSLMGIPSNEFIGSPSITGTLNLQGIASGEQIGALAIDADIVAIGALSGEAFGLPTIWTGTVWTIQAIGIVTNGAFGMPIVATAHNISSGRRMIPWGEPVTFIRPYIDDEDVMIMYSQML